MEPRGEIFLLRTKVIEKNGNHRAKFEPPLEKRHVVAKDERCQTNLMNDKSDLRQRTK
jgi:hypothetical protein